MPKLRLVITLAVILLCNLCFNPCVQAQQSPAFKLFFEKAYLHTDRDVYTQGDTLWFKAYLVNAADNKLINTSNNLHVELIDAQAHIRGSEVIRLDGGTGKGDFDLNDTIPAGTYRLRAYTNWMRNFGDNFFFEKSITLLPAEQAKPADASNATAQATTKPVDAKNVPAITSVPPTPSVRFFPEGGSLVEGVGSIVAVKAEDANGAGVKATGAVLSSVGDTVAHFTCDTLGMGLFTLLPVGGQTYKAISMVNGKTITTSLPTVLKDGLSLHVRQTDSLLLAVVSGKATTQPFSCHLVVRHNGVIQASNDLQLAGQQLAVRIPTGDLPQGICSITIYDAAGKPHCERLVYIHHPQPAIISMKTDKKDYQSYTSTTLNLNGAPGAALSVAVVDDASSGQSDDIVSYLMLGSELRGHVDHAARYFDTTNVNRYKQLDMLLLTQGWRDFVWRRMADTAIHISYGAENSIAVSGLVKDEITEKPLPGLYLTMFASDARGTKTFTSATDSVGRFNIPGMMMYGKHEVDLSAVNGKGKKNGIFELDTINTPVATAKTIRASQEVAVEVSASKAAASHRIDFKKTVQLKVVKVRARNHLVLHSGGIMTSLGYPDQVFNIKPADKEYKTLEWYLLQNVKGAMQGLPQFTGIAMFGLDTALTAPNFYSSKGYKLPPLIFINGRELTMDEYTMAEVYRQTYFPMPITKFKKITLKHVVGTLHGRGADGGIINPAAENVHVDRFLLYLDLTEDAMTDNPGRLTANVQGYYEARDFYKPATANAARNLPYRPTIHWEPMLKTDNTGKAAVTYFNTEPGNVKVIVQGIAADGTPFYGLTGYAVK